MRISKALVLLRISRGDSVEFLQEHPELGSFNEKEDFDLSDEQYFMLYKHFSDEWSEYRMSTSHGYYNDEYNLIVPQEKSIRVLKKHIELGMILQCRGGRESFGVLLGFWGDKLYYFDKEEDFSISQYQLVSFVVDAEDQNRALLVTDFDKFEIVSHENNCFRKPDGSYCDPEEWKAMQRGIPFVAMSRNLSILYFPVKQGDDELYYEMILNETFINAINTFCYAKALSFIPNLEVCDIKDRIIKINQYIDGIDYKSIIDTYRVNKEGRFVKRVGRDDHFHMTTTRSVATNDSYIQSLLPIGEEFSYYDCSYGEDYNYIDEEATDEEKNIALKKYDKDEHFAFLLKEYIDAHYKVAKLVSEFDIRLKQIFNLEKFRSKVKALYFYQYYKSVVIRYNNNEPIH
jgi:hypothetical protein